VGDADGFRGFRAGAGFDPDAHGHGTEVVDALGQDSEAVGEDGAAEVSLGGHLHRQDSIVGEAGWKGIQTAYQLLRYLLSMAQFASHALCLIVDGNQGAFVRRIKGIDLVFSDIVDSSRHLQERDMSFFRSSGKALSPCFDSVFPLVAICAAVASIQPLTAGSDIPMYFQDDFFYYLQVARNIAETGKSTFGGVTPTNGYHPLWQFLLAAVYTLGKEKLVYLFVLALQFLGTIATYLLTRRLLRLSGLPGSLSMAIACWNALFYCSTAHTGMEIILTVPLALAFGSFTIGGEYLYRNSRCFAMGLLAAVIILSRLDASIYFVLFAIATALQSLTLTRLRALSCFAAGFFPVAVYGVLNLYFFGIPGPVSGYAKHLQGGLRFDPATLNSLISPVGLGTLAFIAPAILLTVIGVVALCLRVRMWRSAWFPAVAAGVLFAGVYYLIQSFSSDWPIWTWYRYPLILSSLASAMVIWGFDSPARRDFPKAKMMSQFFCIAMMVLFVASRFGPQPGNPTYMVARGLEQFAKTHPGRYAMGDGAGATAYFMRQPFVQLEGLMMDKAFLENIRAQRPLLDVLHDYNVDYYVVLTSTASGSCRAVSEPSMAGSHSPKMRATLCESPVLHFQDAYRVEVFDMRSLLQRAERSATAQ
jgi:hypothetical protein